MSIVPSRRPAVITHARLFCQVAQHSSVFNARRSLCMQRTPTRLSCEIYAKDASRASAEFLLKFKKMDTGHESTLHSLND